MLYEHRKNVLLLVAEEKNKWKRDKLFTYSQELRDRLNDMKIDVQYIKLKP